MVDLTAASEFMATHARLLDRRRFDVLVHGGAPEGVLAAVDAFRNPDGGYGWGMEPDLRAPRASPPAPTTRWRRGRTCCPRRHRGRASCATGWRR